MLIHIAQSKKALENFHIFSYGDFLGTPAKKHIPQSSTRKKRGRKKWRFSNKKERHKEEPNFEPETTPLNVTKFFSSKREEFHQCLKLPEINDIQSHSDHFLFRSTNGRVFFLGKNDSSKVVLKPQKITCPYIPPKKTSDDSDSESDSEEEEEKSVHIAAGKDFSVFYCENKVFSFGNCEEGQLGLGGLRSTSKAEEVKYFSRMIEKNEKLKVLEISCGRSHVAILMSNGFIYTFGRGKEGQLGHLTNLLNPPKGKNVFKRAMNDKGVYMMFQTAPKVLKCLNGLVFRRFSKVCCGDKFTAMLERDTGDVYMCGEGLSGVLCQNNTKNLYKPAKCLFEDTKKSFCYERKVNCKVDFVEEEEEEEGEEDLESEKKKKEVKMKVGFDLNYEKIEIEEGKKRGKIVEIKCGRNHFLCLTDKDELFASGLNARGECGVNSSILKGKSVRKLKRVIKPKSMSKSKIKKIGCGGNYSMVLMENMTLYVMGNIPGRKMDYLIPKRVLYFEKNDLEILDAFACGKNMFVITEKVEYEYE